MEGVQPRNGCHHALPKRMGQLARSPNRPSFRRHCLSHQRRFANAHVRPQSQKFRRKRSRKLGNPSGKTSASRGARSRVSTAREHSRWRHRHLAVSSRPRVRPCSPVALVPRGQREDRDGAHRCLLRLRRLQQPRKRLRRLAHLLRPSVDIRANLAVGLLLDFQVFLLAFSMLDFS